MGTKTIGLIIHSVKQEGCLHISSRNERVVRCPTLCRITCTDIHLEHSTQRVHQPIRHRFTPPCAHSAECFTSVFYLFLCSAPAPHLLLFLTVSYLLVICSAPLHSFSQHLYFQPLSYNYLFLILTSLLSLLCKFYVTSVSTHLSPMPRELTLPSQRQPLYNFHYFSPSPLSLTTAK